VRVLVLAWVLGFTPIADAFNLSNTVPNMLFDLVLGGIATATFIPVFVERLALDGDVAPGSRFPASSPVLSLFSRGVGAGLVLAPYIIDGFTFLQRTSTAHQSAATLPTNV